MTTIDMHGHLLPLPWLEEVARHPDLYGVQVVAGEGSHTVSRPGEADGFNVITKLWDHGARLRQMDEIGLSQQVAAPPTPLLLHGLDESAAVAVSRLYNETITDLARDTGGRLIPAAMVPMLYPSVAVHELDHAVEQLGCQLLFLSTSIAGLELDDPRFEPVLRRAAELGVPVQLHPSSPEVDPRLKRRALPILLGNPMDTAVAVAALITGGVLDRIPDLEVALVHGGGAFPYLSGRMEHGYHAIERARTSDQSPRGYMGRFHYDSLVHDHRALRFLIDTVGTKRVVIGTDAPYAMGDFDPLESLAAVGYGDDEDIRSGNATRLLGR